MTIRLPATSSRLPSKADCASADGNSASAHIARANSFTEVGRDRQAERLADGTFADLVRFDVLVDEWAAE